MAAPADQARLNGVGRRGRALSAVVRRAREGEADAWGVLCEECRETALREADRILHSRHDAEDVTENFVLHLPDRLQRFHYRDRSTFFAWVRRMVRRDALNFARTERRAARRHRRAVSEARPVVSYDCSALLDLDIDLADALGTLSSPIRRALLMHDLEGYSYSEVARTLHISEAAARARCRRGRASMRNRLRTP